MVGRKDGVEDISDTVRKCVTAAHTPNPVTCIQEHRYVKKKFLTLG